MATAETVTDACADPIGVAALPPAAGWQFTVRSRPLGIACVTLLALLAVTAAASDGPLLWATGKVLLPALALGLLPGMLIALLCRRGAGWRLAELLGVGIALALGLAQVPTLIGMGFGLPTSAVAIGYAVLLLACSVCLCARNHAIAQVALGKVEAVVLMLIMLVAGAAYVKGSPFFSDEEQIHISVIRRIAAEPAPGPHNIYPAEGVVYTHPYPGTHYFMAMVTSLGRGDTLFVYHKLRGFWTFASLLFVYVLARRIFADETLAAVSAITAIALVLNGCWADFFMIFWAQLAPFSHPSDVAMSVLLPGLLLLGLQFFDAVGRRDTAFFLAATLVVAGMVTMVHIRETVQFLVYAGCLLLVTLLVHRNGARIVRLLTLIGAVVLMSLGYGLLHRHLVQHITEFDTAVKAQLLEAIRTGTFDTLVATPFPFHENTLLFSLFYGWNAVAILGSPFLCLAYRHRPLVLMMGASIVVYLIILRLPILSMLYTYGTHADMLLTPVRNFSLFLFLMTGPLLYLIVQQAIRLPAPAVGGALAVVVPLGLAHATQLSSDFWMTWYDLLFLPAIALYLLLAVVLLQPRWRFGLGQLWARLAPADDGTTRRWVPHAVFAMVLLIAFIGSAMWERSLLSLQHITTYSPFLGTTAPTAHSATQLVRSLEPAVTPYWELRHTNATFASYKTVLVGNESVPPPPELIHWARRHLPMDAVLVANPLNAYPLPIFMPQRVVAWPPIVSFNLTYPKQLSPAYYELVDRALAKHGKMPFFNTVESLDDRLEFLRQTHATHVVIDPPNYITLTLALWQWPSHFKLIYTDGSWAVYEVTMTP